MNEIIKEFRELTSQLYIKLIKIFTFEQHGKRYFGVKYNGKTDLLRYEGVVKELEAIYEKQEQFLLTKLQNQLNEIQTMIADEIRTAQKENKPTSRLTSLSVRIDEKFNI